MADDGEVDFFSGSGFDISMDALFDELPINTHSCTHTHTCNPPGPDNTHTHTCFHTHTQILPPSLDGKSVSDPIPHSLSSPEAFPKKQTLGNREAVRKYREKKKAHTALLEEQVMELKAANQQLVRRLQAHAALEAEAARLRSLLAEFRGRIDGELSRSCPNTAAAVAAQKLYHFPGSNTQKRQISSGGYNVNACNIQCDLDAPCLYSTVVGNERGPSTPQEYNSSIAGGSQISCEIPDIAGNCGPRSTKRPKKRKN